MSDATKTLLVVTAVGPDRPGLVKAMSSVILAAGASLSDSRMAILGGEFALLVLVDGSEAALHKVEGDMPSLERELGLKIIAKRTRVEPPRGGLRPYSIRVTGLDRPGIVHGVTELLAARNINVAGLESRVTNAPLTGTPMFVLDAELQVPSDVALSELRRVLQTLCDEENLDFSLDHAG
jgi:glycine cleavage system transcriptional repressor